MTQRAPDATHEQLVCGKTVFGIQIFGEYPPSIPRLTAIAAVNETTFRGDRVH
jgi:hypothetical protein